MDGVNGLDAGVLPVYVPAKELDDVNGVSLSSRNVDCHLNNLLNSSLSTAGLTLQEIVDASRATAVAAAKAAKAARATASEKAVVAAKAIAAAKSALALIASFPETYQTVFQDAHLGRDKMKKPVADDDLLQLGDVTLAMLPNSSSSVERKNDQCEVASGSGERPNTEPAISKTVDFSGLGMEVGSDKPNGSAGGEGAKEGTQVTRKRGRPKSK